MTKEEFQALAATWPTCCDCYDTDETAERLTHTDVLDALDYWVDQQYEKGKPLEDSIREAAPDGLTVYGWTRKTPSDDDVRRLTDSALEAVFQCMGEVLEWSDPDSDGEPNGMLPELFEAAIRKDLETRHIWGCDQTHRIELTLEQLIGIARLEGWTEAGA